LFYFLLLVITGLLAQLSIKSNISFDLTKNHRHSLSASSINVLEYIDAPITIEVFVSPNNPLIPELEKLLSSYTRHSPQLIVQYINPDFEPEKVRSYNIQQQTEMVITSGSRQQHVYDLSEQSLTNALISVSRQQDRWLLFVEGHGERTPLNQANFNLSNFGEQLKRKGFKLQAINLIENNQIPSNSAAVIIASSERPWLQGEIDVINDYIDNGGNVLWLSEPNNDAHLATLAKKLGIAFQDGIIMDPNAETLGISDPEFVLVTDYANHPIGAATKSVTLFPKASALEIIPNDNNWLYTPLLTSQSNSWLKTKQTGLPPESPQTEHKRGPFDIGYLLTRQFESSTQFQQRIAVFGDGDFISNSFVGNGANLALGMALMNWLAVDDQLITIPVKTTLDSQLTLSRSQSIIIGLGFLIVLPLMLLLSGLLIWLYRRKQ
jgi:ABC-type uncharacterized transport system involved in gliding motility auxiliary subunit